MACLDLASARDFEANPPPPEKKLQDRSHLPTQANYGIDEPVIKFLLNQESRPERNEMEFFFYYLQLSYSAEGVREYHLQSFPSICRAAAASLSVFFSSLQQVDMFPD